MGATLKLYAAPVPPFAVSEEMLFAGQPFEQIIGKIMKFGKSASLNRSIKYPKPKGWWMEAAPYNVAARQAI